VDLIFLLYHPSLWQKCHSCHPASRLALASSGAAAGSGAACCRFCARFSLPCRYAVCAL